MRYLTLRQIFPAIAGIYITQTLIYSIAMQSIPALLREAGASLQFVGLSALFMLPWAVKFLWAPAIERLRLPVNQEKRRSRLIILCGQTFLAAGLFFTAGLGIAGYFSLQTDGVWLLFIFFCAALLAATVDIACDGFAIDQLAPAQRGWGNVAQVGGGYIGAMIGGSGFLLIAAQFGWVHSLAAMSVIILLLTLPLYFIREPVRNIEDEDQHRPSLRNAFHRPQIWCGIGVILLTGIGVRIATVMVGPLLVDKGASVAQIGWLYGIYSISAGLIGTFIGGILVKYAYGWRAVWIAVALEAVVLGALAWAVSHSSLQMLMILIGCKFAAMACAWVAIYSAMMGLTSPRQTGVDFTLFQCADALIAMIGGLLGGWLSGNLGYERCFAIAAISTLFAVFVVWRIAHLRSPQFILEKKEAYQQVQS